LPDEERAPLALPSQQRFRIYQEVNNLRLLREGLSEEPLTLSQRDQLVHALETNSKRSFTQIQKLLGFSGQFNLQDEKRTELKGNSTSAYSSAGDGHDEFHWRDLGSIEHHEPLGECRIDWCSICNLPR
jgi:CRISPR-associated endonuclease Csn1